MIGGAMYAQYRCLKVKRVSALLDGTTPAEGAFLLRQSADGASA